MRLAYNNLWDDFTIVASTEDANYPASNTQDYRLSFVTHTTNLSNQTWDIDLGADTDIKCGGILGHNLTSGATIQIIASVNSNYSTTDFTQTFTWLEGNIFECFAVQNYRYWRFKITDAANTDLYISIGRFWLGSYLALDPSSLIPVDIMNNDTGVKSKSQSGQKYEDQGIVFKSFKYDFPAVSSTQKGYLETFYENNREGIPFVFSNTDDVYSVFPAIYACLDAPLNFQYVGENRFTFSLEFSEVF